MFRSKPEPKELVLTVLRNLILMLVPVMTVAAEDFNQNITQELLQVNQQQIENLIVTLESSTARNQFIDNLKTLIAVDEKDSKLSFSFGEALEIDETSSSLMAGYIRFVRELGFNESAFSKALLAALVLVFSLVIIFLNNKVSRTLDSSLEPARNRLHLDSGRFGLVFWCQRVAGYLIASLFTFYTFASIITSPENSLVFLSWGAALARFVALALFLSFLLIISWEVINALFEFYTSKSSRFSDARVRTLIPVARNIMFFAILIVAGMAIVSELGVDLVPLLAGAGVVGVAVGFGAQTMIKDFLNGFIIVFEDLMQVGDVVTLANRTGRIEKITLRKVQLRSLNGTVSTVPHSEISVIENLTKEFSYYLLEVGVAYKEDTDEVIQLLSQVDRDMRDNSEFSELILGELEVLGVDRFDDSAVVIKARIKTRPHDKWKVGREFNRRIKQLFDEEGVEIPFPHRTLYFGNALEQQAAKTEGRLDKSSQAEAPADSENKKEERQAA